ncbi:MAG: thiamine phosphate synthase [Prevotellaceae bacterium]|jgi:thiamine-phosphate pyrophosphorylase|nr:thiamine phosphate synthase [Prevotellaceae bacterium]
MRLIVITSEACFEGEAAALNRLFERGMGTLHLRKPQATEEDLRRLLLTIRAEFRDRIVLHSCFALAQPFRLKGVHLNRRNPACPQPRPSSLSRSCHAIAELEQSDEFDYVFLSPIFDSLSKKGYTRAFSAEDLLQARTRGLIGKKVVALGGVSAATLPLAAAYGFGGVAVLGALWGDYPQRRDEKGLIERFDTLRREILNFEF